MIIKNHLYNLFSEDRLYFINISGNLTNVFKIKNDLIFCITERGTVYQSRMGELRNCLNDGRYLLVDIRDNKYHESLLAIFNQFAECRTERKKLLNAFDIESGSISKYTMESAIHVDITQLNITINCGHKENKSITKNLRLLL